MHSFYCNLLFFPHITTTGKLQKLYETLETDLDTDSTSVLVGSSRDTLYNVSTSPLTRVSISAIERRDTYRKRMSVVSGVGIGSVLGGGGSRIHPIIQEYD